MSGLIEGRWILRLAPAFSLLWHHVHVASEKLPCILTREWQLKGKYSILLCKWFWLHGLPKKLLGIPALRTFRLEHSHMVTPSCKSILRVAAVILGTSLKSGGSVIKEERENEYYSTFSNLKCLLYPSLIPMVSRKSPKFWFLFSLSLH